MLKVVFLDSKLDVAIHTNPYHSQALAIGEKGLLLWSYVDAMSNEVGDRRSGEKGSTSREYPHSHHLLPLSLQNSTFFLGGACHEIPLSTTCCLCKCISSLEQIYTTTTFFSGQQEVMRLVRPWPHYYLRPPLFFSLQIAHFYSESRT